MGWLWSGRGKPRSRPRVARAIVEAREAHAGVASDLGGATALMERAVWSHDLPAPNQPYAPRRAWDATHDRVAGNLGGSMAGAASARRRDFGDVGLLLERAEDTARKLGRSRAEMWEEALRAWLESQRADALDAEAAPDVLDGDEAMRPAPRPWLFEARRQRVWGEIDDTLSSLRTA